MTGGVVHTHRNHRNQHTAHLQNRYGFHDGEHHGHEHRHTLARHETSDEHSSPADLEQTEDDASHETHRHSIRAGHAHTATRNLAQQLLEQHSEPEVHQEQPGSNDSVHDTPDTDGTGPYPFQHGMYPRQPRPPDNMILAVGVCLVCNSCCGLVAILLAAKSTRAASLGDYGEAKKLGEQSKLVSIGSVVVTVTILVIVAVLMFTGHVTVELGSDF